MGILVWSVSPMSRMYWGRLIRCVKWIAYAHAQGVPVLVDGAQAVPHLRVNVQELDADFYVFSAHKYMDLRG